MICPFKGSFKLYIYINFCLWPRNFGWISWHQFFFLSTIACPWLDFGFPPRCPQVVWCHLGEIDTFSTTLAQDGLAECDQPGKNSSKYSAVAGNRTRATGRTDSERSHWAIMTDWDQLNNYIFKCITQSSNSGRKKTVDALSISDTV